MKVGPLRSTLRLGGMLLLACSAALFIYAQMFTRSGLGEVIERAAGGAIAIGILVAVILAFNHTKSFDLRSLPRVNGEVEQSAVRLAAGFGIPRIAGFLLIVILVAATSGAGIAAGAALSFALVPFISARRWGKMEDSGRHQLVIIRRAAWSFERSVGLLIADDADGVNGR